MAWLTYKPTRIPVVSYQPHKTRCSASTIWSNSISTRANILLSSYSKSKPLDVTLKFFRLLPHRDTLSWNTILAASSQQGWYIMVLHLFVEMLALASQLPDSKTLRLVLEACAVTSNLLFALQVHGYILKLQGLYSVDVITNTRLICLYREFGLIENAHQVFERISNRDVVASVAMMAAFNEVGQYEETLRIFSNLLRDKK
ncbi:pentatricopeptide repeat-containing protein At1g33350-like [Aristolochia californica]|uniref:pentatricopeptide repeat-containing protein At1g33350-like n=1 Tax=Aristolochia californica TaxID=171875 RepID=UPI0035E090BD